MKITPTLTALPPRAEGPARDFLQTLSPGQTLQAKVVDVPSAGTARLQIGLIELLAQTKAQLSPGQSLELEVKQLNPLPELKILNPPPSRPPSDQVLQQSLPRQIPVREVIRELLRLVSADSGRPDPAPRLTPQATAAPTTPLSPLRTQVPPTTLSPAPGADPPAPAGARTPPRPTQLPADPSPATNTQNAGKETDRSTAPGANLPAAGANPVGRSTPANGPSQRPAGPIPVPPAAAPRQAPTGALPAGAPATATTPSTSPAASQLGASTVTTQGTLADKPTTATPAPTSPAPTTPPSLSTTINSPGQAGTAPQATRPSEMPGPATTPAPTTGGQTPSGPTSSPNSNLAQLPKPVQVAIQQLLRPAPQAQRLNGTQIQQQLRESGLFLEQQLAQGVIPKTDNKLDMLRLLQVLVATKTQSGMQGIRPDASSPVHATTAVRPGTASGPIAHVLEIPLPGQPPTAIPGLSGGSVTGGITEQLLRLLTGVGRRPSGTNPNPTTPAATTVQQPTTAVPIDPKLKAEQLLQAMQAGKDTRTGPSDAARGGETSANPVAAAQRALTERLLQLVEGGLARVQTHQAATLAQAEDGRQIWQFELPLARAQERDEVLIRLERELVKHGSAEESRWTATLRFAFDNLGSVEARLMLEGERLSSTFWCERVETEQRFARRMPELERGLHKVGLEIGRLTAVQGTPPNPLDLPKPPTGLLDTHV